MKNIVCHYYMYSKDKKCIPIPICHNPTSLVFYSNFAPTQCHVLTYYEIYKYSEASVLIKVNKRHNLNVIIKRATKNIHVTYVNVIPAEYKHEMKVIVVNELLRWLNFYETFRGIPVNVPVDCCICLKTVDRVGVHLKSCLHTFHRNCIMRWYDIKENCPLCRSPIII